MRCRLRDEVKGGLVGVAIVTGGIGATLGFFIGLGFTLVQGFGFIPPIVASSMIEYYWLVGLGGIMLLMGFIGAILISVLALKLSWFLVKNLKNIKQLAKYIVECEEK